MKKYPTAKVRERIERQMLIIAYYYTLEIGPQAARPPWYLSFQHGSGGALGSPARA